MAPREEVLDCNDWNRKWKQSNRRYRRRGERRDGHGVGCWVIVTAWWLTSSAVYALTGIMDIGFSQGFADEWAGC